MSDDFGTVNLRRGERAREIEVLRQHYRQHREALARMTADAPTEHLATEYQRLIAEIDRALGKLDELESVGTATVAAARPAPEAPAATPPPPPPPPRIPPPSERPLASAPQHDLPEAEEESRSRVGMIIAAAVLALAVIAGLVWWASRDGQDEQAIVTADTATTSAAPVAPDTVEAAAPASTGLLATPASHDYGEIRKGTRAVREFQIANDTDEPVTLQVARSTCRCLYYVHAPLIPPHAKESLRITVDGARAKAGALRETVRVSAKSDPNVATTVDVIATIQ